MLSGWFARVLVVTATCQLVTFALRPVLTYQALALGATTPQVGLLVGSFSVLSLVAAVPVGRGIDRRGERGYLLAGAVLVPLAVAAMVAASRLDLLMVASACLGLGQLLVIVACQTVIANGRDRERRDARFATFTLVTSTSQFAAPALSGLLLGGGGGSGGSQPLAIVPVQVAAGVVGVLGLVVATSLVRDPGTLAQRPDHFGSPAPGAMLGVLRDPAVLVPLAVGFCVLSSADLLVAFLPAYGQLHGLSPRTVGFLIAAHGLASIAVRLCMVRLLRRYSRRVLLTTCLVLAATGLALVPVSASPAPLAALMVVTGAGIGLCQPIAISWVAGAVRPEVRGTAMSLRMAGNRLGQTVVPLGVASLAGSVGIAAAFVGPAVLLVLAATLVMALGGKGAGHRY